MSFGNKTSSLSPEKQKFSSGVVSNYNTYQPKTKSLQQNEEFTSSVELLTDQSTPTETKIKVMQRLATDPNLYADITPTTFEGLIDALIFQIL